MDAATLQSEISMSVVTDETRFTRGRLEAFQSLFSITAFKDQGPICIVVKPVLSLFFSIFLVDIGISKRMKIAIFKDISFHSLKKTLLFVVYW